MKNRIKIITGLLLISMQTLFATTRVVEENGIGGAYMTISAAITAAVSGDVIKVFPKANGTAYVGSFTITKSLRILSAVQGQSFKIAGSIYSTAIGFYLSGAEIDGVISITAGNNHVFGCTIDNGNILTNGASSEVFVDACILNNSYINLMKGRVSGCTIYNYQNFPAIKINGSTGIITVDTVFVVGNTIHSSNSVFPMGILVSTILHPFFVANNIIEVNRTDGTSGSGYGIGIEQTAGMSAHKDVCINNTVYTDTGTIVAQYDITFVGGTIPPAFYVENNLAYGNNTDGGFKLTGSSGKCQFMYNYTNTDIIGASADTTNHDNTLVGYWYGAQFFVASALWNKGDPGYTFLNTSLTRNTIGCDGGSYNITNFTSATGNVRTVFMKAPRGVMLNQTFNINADGMAK